MLRNCSKVCAVANVRESAMMSIVWLTAEQVIQLTGWSKRTLWRKAQQSGIESRPAGNASGNGKRPLEYALRSLPADAQRKALAMRLSDAFGDCSRLAASRKQLPAQQLSFPEESAE